jgi:N-acetyl-gamma-glutamyl-phosphate reductase
MITIGIIGGSGYWGTHQNLMFHPHATIDFVFSTTNAGKPLHVAHQMSWAILK